jgi:Uncharacterized protein conserved in bacteria (DUF2330)
MRIGTGAALAFACALGLHLAHAPAAAACGAVAAAGSYVRLASEKTIVVWDAEKKTEHFLRKPVFEGDPKDFGFLVPTPVVPEVAKVDARVFAEMEALVPAPATATAGGGVGGGVGRGGGAVVVEQTVRLGDFELVSLRAGDARALVDWLGSHGYASRASLEMWAQRYVARGWVLNAMRYAPENAEAVARTIEAPAVRLSFAIEAPFYPYTEAPPDAREEQAFVARSKTPPRPRPLDLWVVAAGEVEAREGDAPVGKGETPGPQRVAVASVPSWKLEGALVGSSSWLRVRARDTWTITRFREDVLQRTAWDDLTFDAPRGAEHGRDAPSPDTSRAVALGIVAAAVVLALVLALTDRSPPAR